MKKILAFLTVLFICTGLYAADLSVTTSIGSISLATKQDIDKAKDDLGADYSSAAEVLDRISLTEQSISKIEKEVNSANETLVALEKEYTKELSAQGISDKTIDKLSDSKLTNLMVEQYGLFDTQSAELAQANAEVNRIQTLPEKAQSIIVSNNEKIKKDQDEISKIGSTDDLKARILANEIYLLNLQNYSYNLQLTNISVLQDLSGYRAKIAQVKTSRTEQNIKKLVAKKSEITEDFTNNAEIIEIANNIPALKSHVRRLTFIRGKIRDYRKENNTLSEKMQELDSDLYQISQVEQSISSQINDLGKTLVLSRLLNKQRAQIPSFSIDQNLSELIPNLNMYLFDLREMLNALTNLDAAVDNEIHRSPELAPYRDELTTLFTMRRQDLNTLNQMVANQLAVAIQIKVKLSEFNEKKKLINNEIDQQLFWIKSNQPLGPDFFSQIIPLSHYSFSNLKVKLRSNEFIQSTQDTALFIGLPLIIFAIFAKLLNRSILQHNNDLVNRIDTPKDTVLNTIHGILNNILLMLPKLTLMIIAGAAVICLSLGKHTEQHTVILTMALHFFVYTFSLKIFEPNALVQRHFSVPPYKIKKLRAIFSSVWLYVLPLLIYANIAETDVNVIFFDITSYCVMLFSFVALCLISLRLVLKNLRSITTTSNLVMSVTGFALSLILLVSIASGYMYTVATLINRIAISAYILLGYYLVKETVHRMIHVAIVKYFAKGSNSTENGDDFNASGREGGILKSMDISTAMLTEKLFNLTEYLLIAVTIMLLCWHWSDIASVLNYLNSITLWSKEEVVNGEVAVTESLTLADLFLAALFVAVTMFLNTNLPPILERMMLVARRDLSNNTKSTGYTVRVISSYIIIGFGIVMTASTLGVKWENLQWLVAALSVGLGFGLQEIFANFVSGIILLFERQTRVGDIITLNGLSGTVKKIRIRATTVLSFENKEVLIPNRSFITSELTNWSLSSTVTKLEFDVGIGYSADVDRARKILYRLIRECPQISKDHPTLVYLKELADSSVNFCCEVYVGAISDRKKVTDYLCTRTLAEFAKAGIEIPFNQMDVNIRTLENREFLEQIREALIAKHNEPKVQSEK